MELAQLIYGRLDRSWQAQANCMGVDPDLFFPERGASTREAKEVCRGCVVREDCLEYALANGEKFGIWGGMSERERRRLRRARAMQRRAMGGDAASSQKRFERVSPRWRHWDRGRARSSVGAGSPRSHVQERVRRARPEQSSDVRREAGERLRRRSLLDRR